MGGSSLENYGSFIGHRTRANAKWKNKCCLIGISVQICLFYCRSTILSKKPYQLVVSLVGDLMAFLVDLVLGGSVVFLMLSVAGPLHVAILVVLGTIGILAIGAVLVGIAGRGGISILLAILVIPVPF